MDRTLTPVRATAIGLILTAGPTGCSPDPVDLPPTFAFSGVSTDQTEPQPEARWAADHTGVVVTYGPIFLDLSFLDTERGFEFTLA